MTKDDYSIESITQEEYLNIRGYVEEKLVEEVERILDNGVYQDMVAFLITSVGGVVAYYRKETDKDVCYDYVIGLKINREDYK
jgi:hypothetical protein